MAKQKQSKNSIHLTISGNTVRLSLQLSTRTVMILLTLLGGSPPALALLNQFLK